MKWRILDYSNFKGELRYKTQKASLQGVDKESGEIFVDSIADVNIVLIGLGVSITSATMYHLAKNDVVTVFLDWKGQPISSLYSWCNSHSKIALRQRSQAQLSLPRQKNAWMRVVKSKILHQAACLEAFQCAGFTELKKLSKKVRSGDPSNVEAQAAKFYWRSLFGSDFRRIPRVHFSPFNKALDYGYTLLRSYCIRGIIEAGLTPTLGIHHCQQGNAFALADDLMEPFRPVVDFAVAKNQERVSNEVDIRKDMLEATNTIFTKEGYTVPSAIKSMAQEYGNYAEGVSPTFNPPQWYKAH